MDDKLKAYSRSVVKANDALMRAKEEEKERGVPVPKKLRDNLKNAIAAYENYLRGGKS